MPRNTIHFTVNGEAVELGGPQVFAPLSDTLRYHLRKTGTKVVCAEGDCGACTVMLGRSRDTRYRSINSCIYPTFSADGCHLVTVEGLAGADGLHEIQQSMVRCFGGQCGFCTPGFVMSIANLYEHKADPTEQNVKNYLTGNLCRCTGYQPIIQAALNVEKSKLRSVSEMYPLDKQRLEIQDAILIETESRQFFAPATLQQAAEYKSRNPKTRLFSGATDLGVQINKGKNPGNRQMSLHLIPELDRITEKDGRIYVGARATLDQLQRALSGKVPAFERFLNIFASPQIKNSGTLVGNLANGSPIADTTPFLFAVDAEVELLSIRGPRRIPVTKFFTGYKTFDMAEDEFITAINWPLTGLQNAKLDLYKVSQRRDLDISCVNACFWLHTDGGKITDARIVYGGLGPTPLRLEGVEKSLSGRKLESSLVASATAAIAAAVQPKSDVRGTAEYRTWLAQKLFQKYVQEHFDL
jgi:xanthine dehydrogenase small subunit